MSQIVYQNNVNKAYLDTIINVQSNPSCIRIDDVTIDSISQNEIMKYIATQQSDEKLFNFIKQNNSDVGIYDIYKNELKLRYDSSTVEESLKLELLLFFEK